MTTPLLPPLDDGPGPARPISDKAASALIRRTLELHQLQVSTRRRPMPWAIAAAVALALTATSATAAWWITQRAPEPTRPKGGPSPRPAPANTSSAATSTSGAREESASQLAIAPPPPSAQAARAEPTDEAEVKVDDVAPGPRKKSRRGNDGPRATPPRPGPGPSPKGEAADLLAEANRLLAEGRAKEAEQRYVAVTVRFPGSSSAYVAWVAAAGVRKGQLADPSGAERAYRAALGLDPRGPLTPEIHVGLAECARALGHPTEEREALLRYLGTGPSGPRRAKAERRLAELNPP